MLICSFLDHCPQHTRPYFERFRRISQYSSSLFILHTHWKLNCFCGVHDPFLVQVRVSLKVLSRHICYLHMHTPILFVTPSLCNLIPFMSASPVQATSIERDMHLWYSNLILVVADSLSRCCPCDETILQTWVATSSSVPSTCHQI